MNNKPFPCKDCRFLDKESFTYWACRRNPPTFGESGDEFPLIWVDGTTDCFQGEPRETSFEFRGCNNSKPEQPHDRLVRLVTEAICDRLSDPNNVEKGDDWKAETISQLFVMAQSEMNELCGEIYNQKGVTKARVREEIGDCIAFLAMLLDRIETEER